MRLFKVLAALVLVCSPLLGHAQASSNAHEAALAERAPQGRLPGDVVPLAYRLDLNIDPRAAVFQGQVEIDVMLKAPSETIWLHGKDLAVNSVAVTDAAGETHPGRYLQVLESGVAAITVDTALAAGKATLALEYGAEFNRNLAGLFRVEERGDAYALAKSESIQARRFLPGFDEPGMKAPFDIALTVPAGYHAISNAPEIRRSAAATGFERVEFATTPPMPTYLLSLAVGPFDEVTRPDIPANAVRGTPIPLRGYARRGRGAELAYVLAQTPRMVEIFETALQQPYPFRKLDIIAAPEWPSGATELSAAITYRESLILADGEPAPGARLALLGVHAHEIAHMWFGNSVTPPWWDDLWLKEGFATWGTPLALGILEPEGGHDLNAATRALGAMRLDALASTRAIREPISDNDDIRNAYDAITYSKSLAVITMMDAWFGAGKFRPALGEYLGTFADGVADAEDFYSTIGSATGTPILTRSFRDFVEQRGVPEIDVRVDCSGDRGRLTLAQRRYRPLGSPIEDRGQIWRIPFCARTAAGDKQCQMLEQETTEIPLTGGCPAWVMPNAGGTGYYRWSMDEAGWQALLAAFPTLTDTEALSLIDSAFAAFEAGALSPSLLGEVIATTANADARQVVTAPLRNLRRYDMRYGDMPGYGALAAFAREVYAPRLARAETGAGSDALLLATQLREYLALHAQHEPSRRILRERAAAFTGFQQERNPSALDSDAYAGALTVAVQDLGPDFFRHLLEFSGSFDDPRFGSASAVALAAGRSTELAALTQNLLLEGTLGSRETFDALASANGDARGAELHWAWTRAHLPQLLESVPDQWRRRMPSLASAQCSDADASGLEKLFAANAALAPGHERSLGQTGEAIRLCAAQRPVAARLFEALAE